MNIPTEFPELSIDNMSVNWEEEVWITCISYEMRSQFIFNNKLKDSFKAKLGLFLENEEVKQFFDKDFKNRLINSGHFEIKEFIQAKLKNPTFFIQKFLGTLKKYFKDSKSVYINIDISTIPRSELLIILHLLKEQKTRFQIRFFYTAVEDYGGWLSKGFEKKIVIPYYEGQIQNFKKNLLLIIAGFDQERIVRLIDEIEPNFVVYGQAIKGFNKRFDERVKNCIEDLRYKVRDFEIKEIDAINIESAINTLSSIISDQVNNYNIFICPSGTKLQLLACFIVHEKFPQVQIIYSIPFQYNYRDYSRGFFKLYTFQFKELLALI